MASLEGRKKGRKKREKTVKKLYTSDISDECQETQLDVCSNRLKFLDA